MTDFMQVGSAGLVAAAAIAIGVQLNLIPLGNLIALVQLGLAIGKTIRPLSDFPYECRHIDHPLLDACEDMWISHTRKLYLACSDSQARKQWFPAVDQYNLTGRSQVDGIVVMDLDQPGLGRYPSRITARRLDTPDYSGVAGDGLLSLTGFTGVDLPDGGVRFLVVNNRPAVDLATGKYAVNQAYAGVNATIEVFEREKGHDFSLRHVSTVASTIISTPNRVAAFGSEGFYITNDHGKVKSGDIARFIAMLGGGDVTFCSYTEGCRVVASGLSYPNGLMLHSNGLLYVPSAAAGGGVYVYQPQGNGSLEKIGKIEAFYAIDNLSEDTGGNIFAAVISKGRETLAYVKDPSRRVPASGVLRICATENGHETEMVLEDRNGEALPATTTVVHDVITGRLYLSGASSPFVTVCNPTVLRAI
ncbi:hypothetical protein B0T25DRAFT_473853 [Lasiosphaeria hispida]|uniref:Serum paraoxonase/arylesterase n=1 Tax=Lasiosphaeria hispida TaxID=260671 RepID=A0AAJ0HST4_9PEZI|nr:hypothetical protein B0T25DRAFT_473853 [Lasiosphaeria hispida]